MKAFEFLFSSFWVWSGSLLFLIVLLEGMAKIIVALKGWIE